MEGSSDDVSETKNVTIPNPKVVVEFQCENCALIFSTQAGFMQHLASHHNSEERPPDNCTFCDQPLAKKENRNHRVFFHNAEKNRIQCSVCDKSYSRPMLIRRHYGEAHKEFGITKTFICEVCGYAAYHKEALDNHKKSCHEKKMILCSSCPKKFRTRMQLHYHMPVHTGATPYKCKTCGKEYKHRSGLFYHGKMHKNQFLECPFCGKKIIAKHNMDAHKKVCRFVY